MSTLRRLASEPLVQFLAIGACVFALAGPAPSSDEIVIDEGLVWSITTRWQAARQRPPTQAELDEEIAQHLRQEVLTREAMKMGLHHDDIVIQRRLAQKMDFLASDLGGAGAFGMDELRAWHTEHAELFTEPATVGLRQVLFTEEQHTDPKDAAWVAYAAISADPPTVPTGDASLLPASLEAATAQDLRATFGPGFASGVMKAEGLGWLPPIASSFGVHLVEVTSLTPARPLSFEEARDDVQAELTRARRMQAREDFYQAALERYEVIWDLPDELVAEAP